MSRPERWWRPPTTRRPAQRARARRMYTDKELDQTFDVAYECGQVAERKRQELLHDGLQRLVEAVRAADDGDPGPMQELTRQSRADDLLDLADEAGATPLPVADPEQLVDEVERFLRGEQD
ncbi:hypothetical protein [Micromonospora coerulea]|uniref:hypothetical protein n=1 Tax=Micromonospora coerulea TaxID=47856 RepID=UPI0019060BD6|nr:hypothetical protein [Micromonospora veneta]